MRLQIIIFCVFLIIGLHGYGQEPTEDSFKFSWDNGFKLKSTDGLFSLGFGGQIFLDHAYFFQDNDLNKNFGSLESKSRTEFRSARLYFAGDLYENTEFKFQIEFAGEKVSLKDVYLGIKNIPVVGTIRLGHFNEPFRFSSLTSGKYLTFLERASNNEFAPKRNTGIILFNDFLNGKLSAQFGAFHNANNGSNNVLTNDGYALSGRITGLPYQDLEKNRLLHLGASFSFRKPDSKTYNISVPPSSHLAEKYLQTGTIPNVNEVDLLNFELVYIHGPFSLQSEYLTAKVKTDEEDPQFSNYYAQLSWFLTGETKNFKGSYKGFGSIKPKKNFGGIEKGAGAWELAARYSKTDLSNDITDGGIQSEILFGVNWHLNPVTRLMINYALTEIETQGKLDFIQARFQVEF